MIQSIVLTLALASLTYSMTTPSGHHGHHEHPEKGTISFYYDFHTHYLAGKTTTNCYIWPLHSTQQQLVHTVQGLEMLELAMIQMITGGEAKLQNNDLGTGSRNILHFCHGHQLYDLGVKPVVSTTPPAPVPAVVID